MSKVVRDYYNEGVIDEWERLAKPYPRLELLSTLRLVDDFFPNSGRVIDIGGGPGRYTIELLQRGYQVTLIDLSEANASFARDKLGELELDPEAVHAADARSLPMLETASFDAALEWAQCITSSMQRNVLSRLLSSIASLNQAHQPSLDSSIPGASYAEDLQNFRILTQTPHTFGNCSISMSRLESKTHSQNLPSSRRRKLWQSCDQRVSLSSVGRASRDLLLARAGLSLKWLRLIFRPMP